ncbi:hypothetical protein Tco_0307110 [Tanacetum coccineum]
MAIFKHWTKCFSGTNGEDVVDHVAKVLEILELIKIPNVDPNQLRLHVFLISLTGNARKWWNDEDFWIKGGDDEVLKDDIVSSDDESEESDNTNYPNSNADSFFKPYLDAQERDDTCTIGKGHECFDEHMPMTYDCDFSKLTIS